MDGVARQKSLHDILTEKQINYIISQNSRTGSTLLKYELNSASENMSGFLGDHFKVTLHIKQEDLVKKVHLFIKTIPSENTPKAQFINENNFFRRESLIYEIFDNFTDEECNRLQSLIVIICGFLFGKSRVDYEYALLTFRQKRLIPFNTGFTTCHLTDASLRGLFSYHVVKVIYRSVSDSESWGVKALIHSHEILVLPDLSVEGYKTYPAMRYLDLDHVLVTLKSLARFHAAFAKHQTQVNQANCGQKWHEKYSFFLEDPQFLERDWLRAAVETTTSVIREFSSNIKQYPLNLKESVANWYHDACSKLRDYDDTLNVLIHKDLWTNNILFKYSGGNPANAVLIDYQCARYAPPAVDLMVFLYFTTSRKFRELHEREILDYYFSEFFDAIDEPTKHRLDKLNYDRQAFLNLCENLRVVGMIVPLEICPFILMSSQAAQKSFDNPNTFQKNFMEDRSAVVLEYARENEYYRTRLLDISEEFIERHI